MNGDQSLNQTQRIGTGLIFIIFPLLFVFAFAVHPGLLRPRLMGPEDLILRAHQNGLLQFGHVLVTLSTALLVVIALHFKKLLDRSSAAWGGFPAFADRGGPSGQGSETRYKHVPVGSRRTSLCVDGL